VTIMMTLAIENLVMEQVVMPQLVTLALLLVIAMMRIVLVIVTVVRVIVRLLMLLLVRRFVRLRINVSVESQDGRLVMLLAMILVAMIMRTPSIKNRVPAMQQVLVTRVMTWVRLE